MKSGRIVKPRWILPLFCFIRFIYSCFMKRTAVFLYVLFISCFCFSICPGSGAGSELEYNADSVRAVLDKAPYFTLFKDNYFIGGTTIGHKPTAANSDVKFQLSIAQRLTKSKLPFDTYLFIQYTRKPFGMFSRNLCPCAT